MGAELTVQRTIYVNTPHSQDLTSGATDSVETGSCMAAITALVDVSGRPLAMRVQDNGNPVAVWVLDKTSLTFPSQALRV